MIDANRTARLVATLAALVTFVFLVTLPSWADQAKDGTVGRESSLEDCFTVAGASDLKWQWRSGEPLDFNIHYHRDGKTVYPVKEPGQTSGEGMLAFEQSRKICMMWRNSDLSDISLTWTREFLPR